MKLKFTKWDTIICVAVVGVIAYWVADGTALRFYEKLHDRYIENKITERAKYLEKNKDELEKAKAACDRDLSKMDLRIGGASRKKDADYIECKARELVVSGFIKFRK